MMQNHHQYIFKSLKSFDAKISHRRVDSVAGAALRFVEELLKLAYLPSLHCPDKVHETLQVLTPSTQSGVSALLRTLYPRSFFCCQSRQAG
jgi:hypothetical protein